MKDPKLTKAYEVIANMSNQAVSMRKTIELLLNIIPKEQLIKALAELHDRRMRDILK